LSIADVGTVARAINGIVAPAIMISASALIILALQGKYSHLIDRLRSLNEERRRITQAADPKRQAQRMSNVLAQIEMILTRARFVRNSIVSLYIAIALFVISSIVIGVAIVLGRGIPVGSSLLVFMAGMVFVLCGTIYALRDIARAYSVVQLELRGVPEFDKE
jgi:hypothetical protein